MSLPVVFMFKDLGAPLSSTVFATGAQGDNDVDRGGYGVVGVDADPALVSQACEYGGSPGYTVSKLDGSIAGLLKPGKELLRRTPFSRIPQALLDPAALPRRPLCCGRWQ